MFLGFSRPRYQVSVYRTIGPLVSISFGQSEESSNEVNCFSTDNTKILILELYYYSVYFSRITL